MVHTVFDRLFGKLLGRWHRYQDAPREPERVTDLASARAELDDTRAEIAEARARYHPEARPASPESASRTALNPEEYALLRLRGIHPEG